MPEIIINCEGTHNIELENLIKFQDDIKKSSEENKKKLKESIKKAFIAPFFIYIQDGIHYLLDGHQRKVALTELKQEGWQIPPLPAVAINAESVERAKQIILEISSQYGEYDNKKLQEYITKYKIQTKNLILREKILIIQEKSVITNVEKDVIYKSKFELIIDCGNETELKRMYSELTERGCKCKISIL